MQRTEAQKHVHAVAAARKSADLRRRFHVRRVVNTGAHPKYPDNPIPVAFLECGHIYIRRDASESYKERHLCRECPR